MGVYTKKKFWKNFDKIEGYVYPYDYVKTKK